MHCKSYSHFFSKKFQNICVSLDVNFNESLTNNVVSFEQLDPDLSPYDFELFSRLNENMRWGGGGGGGGRWGGGRFQDLEELEDAEAEHFRMYERGCLASRIQKLPSRWKSVTEHKGHYFVGF